MLVAIALIALSSPPDLQRAQRLYDQARYEAALAALGDSCDTATSVAACERLRAFVHVALGQDAEALAAFGRLLAADPNATLGDDVSPKLQATFKEVKRNMGELTGLKLEPIHGSESGGPWTLRLRVPQSAGVENVTVYISPANSQTFEMIKLRREGDTFVCDYFPPPGGTGPARYFLEVSLPSTGALSLGSSAAPKQAPVVVGDAQGGSGAQAVVTSSGGTVARDPVTGAALGPLTVDPLAPPPSTEPPPAVSSSSGSGLIFGLPSWAVWSIAGGLAAVVAGGVTAGVLLSKGGSDPGKVAVQFRFEDEGAR